MHCELIFMHRVLIFMHREKISYLTEIYASQEEFIPCRIYAFVGIFSCPAKDHASRFNFHALGEDFIPRWNLCIARRFHIFRNLCIARRFHPSQNLRIAGWYSCPARNHALPEKELCMPREIFTPQHQLHLYLAKVNAKRIIENNEKISTLHPLFIYFRHQMKNTLKITLHT